ncbi:MAG: hypothetical protein ABFS38_10830 [Bacteroidota bacterium]
MRSKLHWKRGVFSNTSEIYSEEKPIGSLKENSFKQSAEGEINGKRYRFHTKGVFKPETQITDADSNTVMGRIEYNSWMTKATIRVSPKSFQWKYENIWNTRWSLTSSEGRQMKFQGNSSKGSIEMDGEDDLLVLTGLFITNYYRQMAIVILVAVLVPIFASVSN